MTEFIKLDPVVLSMPELPSQWSPEMINNCLHIINFIKIVSKKNSSSVKIINETTREIGPPINYGLYLLNLTKILFNKGQYGGLVGVSHLTKEKNNLLIDIFNNNLINSADDFYYLIAHLPFYKEFLDLLNDEIENNVNATGNNIIFNEITQMGGFIFPSIQNWILVNCDRLTTINFIVKTKNGEIPIQLRLIYHNHPSIEREIKDIINQVSSIVISIVILYDLNHPKALNLTYIMTPFKKVLNNFQKNTQIDNFLISRLKKFKDLKYNYARFNNPISSLNVNSGVSTLYKYSPSQDSIVIWRTEEFQKVLIHELTHYYELEKGTDFSIDRFNLNISNNYSHFPKEVFTELQTWLFYILWLLGKSSKNYTETDIVFILNYERKYSIYNISKIFKHYQITKFDQFLQNNSHFMINASSSVLYYYILKTICLFSLNPFIESLVLPYNPELVSKTLVSKQFKEHTFKKSIGKNQHFENYVDEILKSTQTDQSLNMMGITK